MFAGGVIKQYQDSLVVLFMRNAVMHKELQGLRSALKIINQERIKP